MRKPGTLAIHAGIEPHYMDIQFLGAAGTVTGSCYLFRVGKAKFLLECGQIQGSRVAEAQNREPLPIQMQEIDAIVLSHAHIDHSGRLPWLKRQGYDGPIYTHHASHALCEIMLRDAAYLNEKDAEWENRKRQRKGLPNIEPLYTQDDAAAVMDQFTGIEYEERREILPGVEIRLTDAGHILGAAIVELWLTEDNTTKKVVFSGDLGHRGAPVMIGPAPVEQADLVIMESTYGNRNHRSTEATLEELRSVFEAARANRGNVIIPAFAVGRTQDLIYLLEKHYDDWHIGDWQVFLDSPMAIQATEVYSQFDHLYSAKLFGERSHRPTLKNLAMSRSAADSMAINRMQSGAIVIAGSGMCSGGRVMHHLKHNVWRPECHLVIVGYQAYGTIGRQLVDGRSHIKLWGELIKVNAQIHTVGGLSAHADQTGLLDWYRHFQGSPPVYLIHGERPQQTALRQALHSEFAAEVTIPEREDRIQLN